LCKPLGPRIVAHAPATAPVSSRRLCKSAHRFDNFVTVAERYFWLVAVLHLTQRMYLSFWARLVEAGVMEVMAEWM
jgi:hypothetical protein